jgi:hypothetical protein
MDRVEAGAEVFDLALHAPDQWPFGDSAASIALSSVAGILGMGVPVLRAAGRACISRRASRPPRPILLVR